MQRRAFIRGMAATGIIGSGFGLSGFARIANAANSISVDQLPKLTGELTLYLGRGEGGLYENVLQAIQDRNPGFELNIRRGATAALANTLIAEAKAGVKRADLFWAVDTGSIGVVTDAGLAKPLPQDLIQQLSPGFQYPLWSPVTGRIRTLPYNTDRLTGDEIPDSILALADSDVKIGWAPAYASFQSFVTAMRLLEGDKVTKDWLKAINSKAKKYAGELGVVMGVERGEVDIGFANHYYTLRLKAGKPDASVSLAYTNNDAGCLVNASGIVALSDGELPVNFIRYLLTKEVQSYLASEAYEIPLVSDVASPPGLQDLSTLNPPELDLRKLADLRPTINMMRSIGLL